MVEAAKNVSIMSAGPNPAAQKFAARLSQELKVKGWGNRTLARALAKEPKGHKQIENARAQVREYMRGEINPSPRKRREIAVALGLAPNALDEEEDMLLELINSMIKLRQHKIETGDPYAVLK
jgi:transcriptional regulator with XRE-family HTH domain